MVIVMAFLMQERLRQTMPQNMTIPIVLITIQRITIINMNYIILV